MNSESILNSIKKLIGIEPDYTHFDLDLMIHINSIFTILNQLGVGTSPFSIIDSTATWSDFLGDDMARLNDVKTYVYLRVRMLFDPPSSSAVMDAINQSIKELEWRINVAVDP